MNDQERRIKLAVWMGWKQIAKRRLASRSLKKYWLTGRSPDQKTGRWGVKQIPDPFTDANDERAVFRFMCGKIFSVRRLFFIELDRIVQERLDMKGRATWPEAMMFIQDGDIARAALKVIEK